jgi:transcription antitermination factor NusG
MDEYYILTTEPAREIHATAGLIARRFEAFCPSVYTMRPVTRMGAPLKDKAGRRVLRKVTSPMFRGYVFIKQSSALGHFEKVERVAGVGRFMRCGETYATLPAALMAAIRAEEDRQLSKFEESTKPHGALGIPFVAGGSARIVTGPYDDWVGKMVKVNKNGRLRMLVNMFGRETFVDVDAAQIQAAG